MLLLKQNKIKKKQVNKLVKLEIEFDAEKNKKYEFEAIKDNAIYNEVEGSIIRIRLSSILKLPARK